MRESNLDAVVKFLVSVGFKFDSIGDEFLNMEREDGYVEVYGWGVKGYIDGLFCKCDDGWDEVLAFLERKFS